MMNNPGARLRTMAAPKRNGFVHRVQSLTSGTPVKIVNTKGSKFVAS